MTDSIADMAWNDRGAAAAGAFMCPSGAAAAPFIEGTNNMNVIRYIDRLKTAEGLKLSPYKDHLGRWTIGFGTCYWMGDPVTEGWRKISIHTANFMLQANAMQAIIEAAKSVDNFQGLCGTRQECLAEMAYQLGGRGLRKFKKMLAAVNEQDWYTAHDETLDSKMGRDPHLNSRTARYARMLLMGDSYEPSHITNPWI